MSSKRFLLLILPLLLLAACQPAELPPAEPLPTPQLITLASPPALRWLAPTFNACAAETAVSILIVDEADAPDVSLYWGEPQGTADALFQLGEDKLVLIAHPSSSAVGLSLGETQDMFTGAVDAWPNGDPLTVYVLPVGHPVQDVFEAALGKSIPKSVDIQIAPSLEAMQQYVADDPTALGVLPQSWLNDEIKTLNWEVETSQPILASYRSERSEAFIRCVQGAVAEKLKN
jgi:hypothetical protein